MAKNKNVDLEDLQESVVTDLKSKKFAFTLPWIIGLFSAVSTVIGGYWYVRNEFEGIIGDVESLKEAHSPSAEEFKELKDAVIFLNQQVTQVGTSGNQSGMPPMILQLNNTNKLEQPKQSQQPAASALPSTSAAQPAAALPSVNDRLNKFKKK
jgi:hypothetical protein